MGIMYEQDKPNSRFEAAWLMKLKRILNRFLTPLDFIWIFRSCAESKQTIRIISNLICAREYATRLASLAFGRAQRESGTPKKRKLALNHRTPRTQNK